MAELDSICPNVSFSFSSASGAVNFKPSVYLVYSGYNLGSPGRTNTYYYNVYIANMGTGMTIVRSLVGMNLGAVSP